MRSCSEPLPTAVHRARMAPRLDARPTAGRLLPSGAYLRGPMCLKAVAGPANKNLDWLWLPDASRRDGRVTSKQDLHVLQRTCNA